MADLSHAGVLHLLAAYGYWAVLAMVAMESTGLPVPGEATLSEEVKQAPRVRCVAA